RVGLLSVPQVGRDGARVVGKLVWTVRGPGGFDDRGRAVHVALVERVQVQPIDVHGVTLRLPGLAPPPVFPAHPTWRFVRESPSRSFAKGGTWLRIRHPSIRHRQAPGAMTERKDPPMTERTSATSLR